MIHTHLAIKHSWIINSCTIFRGKYILFYKKYSLIKEKKLLKLLEQFKDIRKTNKYLSYDGLINMNNNMKINMKNSNINMMY